MNYRNTRNYENLEKCIYDGVGEYEIPEIGSAHIDVGDYEFISFSQAARCTQRADKGIHFFSTITGLTGYGPHLIDICQCCSSSGA